ncbi:CTR copper uptake transporter [Lactarius deliciosus]|nr:CTR copper uptake transporter [Lactarius deliciosus]
MFVFVCQLLGARAPRVVRPPPLEQTLTMYSLALLSLIVTFSFTCTLAHDNGMDMNMDQGMSMSMGNMVMYLHFTPGDNLWFLGWAPRTAGAMVGTCIGLFMLAVAERWLSAMRAVMEGHWRTRAQIVLADNLNTSSVATSDKPSSKSSQPSYDTFRRRVPPFILSYDVPRGIMRMALASIGFLFMLAVMTFQLSFIFSIVIGLGVGETLFGRYSPHLEHPH